MNNPITKTLLSTLIITLAACGGSNSNKSKPTEPLDDTIVTTEDHCPDINETFDLPVSYNLEGEQLRLQTESGLVPVSMFPWGSHVQPYTGHKEGNGKSDWIAWMATDYSEMQVLEDKNDNGICDDKFEVCGMTLAQLKAKNPAYVAVGNNQVVTAVVLEQDGVGASEASGGQQLRVVTRYCNYYYGLLHVGYGSELLRQRMLEQGYADIANLTEADVGVNLITDAPVVFDKGEAIAYPEISARALEDHPGYYRATNIDERYPNARIEFTARDESPGVDVIKPYFLFLEDAVQQKLSEFLVDPFPLYLFEKEDQWLWGAEAVPWTSDVVPQQKDDFVSVHSRFGGWFETTVDEACTFGNLLCDQRFSIFPIHTTSPYYAAGLYDNEDVRYLTYYRAYNEEDMFKNGIYGEVLNPLAPNPQADVITVKWRKQDSVYYQHIAYRLVPEQKYMLMRFSAVGDSPLLVAPLEIPEADDVCDGLSILCMDHDYPF